VCVGVRSQDSQCEECQVSVCTYFATLHVYYLLHLIISTVGTNLPLRRVRRLALLALTSNCFRKHEIMQFPLELELSPPTVLPPMLGLGIGLRLYSSHLQLCYLRRVTSNCDVRASKLLLHFLQCSLQCLQFQRLGLPRTAFPPPATRGATPGGRRGGGRGGERGGGGRGGGSS
jgi:hypothetical protein